MSLVSRQKLATVVVAGLALVPAGAAVAYAQLAPGDPSTAAAAPVSASAVSPAAPAPSAWAAGSAPSAPAAAPTSAPAAAPGTSASAAAPSRKAAKAAIAQIVRRRTVHGDLVVKDNDGQYVTVTFDRGTVQAATATSLTVQRADGPTVELTLDATTAYHGIDSASALQTGRQVVVLSRNGTATHVAQRAK